MASLEREEMRSVRIVRWMLYWFQFVASISLCYRLGVIDCTVLSITYATSQIRIFITGNCSVTTLTQFFGRLWTKGIVGNIRV